MPPPLYLSHSSGADAGGGSRPLIVLAHPRTSHCLYIRDVWNLSFVLGFTLPHSSSGGGGGGGAPPPPPPPPKRPTPADFFSRFPPPPPSGRGGGGGGSSLRFSTGNQGRRSCYLYIYKLPPPLILSLSLSISLSLARSLAPRPHPPSLPLSRSPVTARLLVGNSNGNIS